MESRVVQAQTAGFLGRLSRRGGIGGVKARLCRGTTALLQLVSHGRRSSLHRNPVVDRISEELPAPDLVRERVVRASGSQGTSRVLSAAAETARALDELRLSAIPIEDVERIEVLVDSLIERSQDPEALVDLLAGISLQATAVAAIVKDYARLRRMVETRSRT